MHSFYIYFFSCPYILHGYRSTVAVYSVILSHTFNMYEVCNTDMVYFRLILFENSLSIQTE